jgi:hypothetical protein
MTFAGKLFVLVNLAFSAMMAVAALGLYTTGLDYGPEAKKDATPKPPARVTALQKDITDVIATIPAVQGSWRETRTSLLTLEVQREKNRKAYDEEMALLKRGPDAEKDRQVREVVMGADLLPKLVPTTMLPEMKPADDRAGQPLRPTATYNIQMDDVRKQIADLVERLQKRIKDDEALTLLLTGEPGTRALRQMLVDERVKREGVIAEQNSVRPLFINIAVDSQRARKRLAALQEQIEQLKAYLRKMHKVDVAMDRR